MNAQLMTLIGIGMLVSPLEELILLMFLLPLIKKCYKLWKTRRDELS